MAKSINITALRENAGKVVNEVTRSGKSLTITERSKPMAVIVDYETFVAMQKRLTELEAADLEQVITDGRREHQQGRTQKIKSLRELR